MTKDSDIIGGYCKMGFHTALMRTQPLRPPLLTNTLTRSKNNLVTKTLNVAPPTLQTLINPVNIMPLATQPGGGGGGGGGDYDGGGSSDDDDNFSVQQPQDDDQGEDQDTALMGSSRKLKKFHYKRISGQFSDITDFDPYSVQASKNALYGGPQGSVSKLYMGYPDKDVPEATVLSTPPVYQAAYGTQLGVINNVFTAPDGSYWLEIANPQINNPSGIDATDVGYMKWDASLFDADRLVNDMNTWFDTDVSAAAALKNAQEQKAQSEAAGDWIPNVPNWLTVTGSFLVLSLVGFGLAKSK